jgi:hypothetical protein
MLADSLVDHRSHSYRAVLEAALSTVSHRDALLNPIPGSACTRSASLGRTAECLWNRIKADGWAPTSGRLSPRGAPASAALLAGTALACWPTDDGRATMIKNKARAGPTDRRPRIIATD